MFMNEFSEDINFPLGDLQTVHTRYVKMVNANISYIIENDTRVKTFVGILNWLRFETEYIDNLFIKTKDDYQETVAALTTFTRTPGCKLMDKRGIFHLDQYSNTSLGLAVAKMSRKLRELNTL